jgi:N-acetylneuraminic acid mutarotase
MKRPRSTGFTLIFKNKIYVFGGYTSTADKKRSKTIEVYDPFKNYWENLNVKIKIFR